MPRSAFIFGITLACTAILNAQDSIVAENIFSHEIRNGSRTALKHIVGQNTYNKEGKKVLQLMYFDSIPNIKTYTLFFYDDDLLISKESFTGTSEIVSVERLTYNTVGNLLESKLYEPDEKIMRNTGTTTLTYSDTALIKKVVLNASGKRVSQTIYVYRPGEFIETTTYKKGAHREHLKSVTIKSFLTEGTISSITVDSLFFNKTSSHYRADRVYDNTTGRLVSEYWFDAHNQSVRSFQYRWEPDGTLRDKGTIDPAGNYLEFISFRREPYVVNLGDQQMYQLEEPVNE